MHTVPLVSSFCMFTCMNCCYVILVPKMKYYQLLLLEAPVHQLQTIFSSVDKTSSLVPIKNFIGCYCKRIYTQIKQHQTHKMDMDLLENKHAHIQMSVGLTFQFYNHLQNSPCCTINCTNLDTLIPIFLHHVGLSNYTNSDKLVHVLLHHADTFIHVITQHNPSSSSSFFACLKDECNK